MEEEIIKANMERFKEMKRLRNKQYYSRHAEEQKKRANKNYKYTGEQITCEICNCEIVKKSYRQHCLSDRHNNNRIAQLKCINLNVNE